MQTVIISSPSGVITITVADYGAKPMLVGDVIKSVSKIYQYQPILTGVDAGTLIDLATDLTLHHSAEIQPGEYKLLVLGC